MHNRDVFTSDTAPLPPLIGSLCMFCTGDWTLALDSLLELTNARAQAFVEIEAEHSFLRGKNGTGCTYATATDPDILAKNMSDATDKTIAVLDRTGFAPTIERITELNKKIAKLTRAAHTSVAMRAIVKNTIEKHAGELSARTDVGRKHLEVSDTHTHTHAYGPTPYIFLLYPSLFSSTNSCGQVINASHSHKTFLLRVLVAHGWLLDLFGFTCVVMLPVRVTFGGKKIFHVSHDRRNNGRCLALINRDCGGDPGNGVFFAQHDGVTRQPACGRFYPELTT